MIRSIAVFVLLWALSLVQAGCGSGDVKASAAASEPHTINLHVQGMNCTHCENAIAQTVSAIKGVESCEASHLTGKVVVVASSTGLQLQIEQAIARMGYTVQSDNH